ncbi:MAG: hypothetical protein JXA87_06060 [Thermoleophilia bacterium]|nr:hypothetical protein [Thermoleophilia bacterium]
MAKTYKFTPAELPPLHRGRGVYDEIIADFIAQGAESMQVSIEGMKPATLRAGLRRALKGNEDVKMAQRGEETFLVRRNIDQREG